MQYSACLPARLGSSEEAADACQLWVRSLLAPPKVVFCPLLPPSRSQVPEKYLDDKTIFHLNPSGRFVIGGPHGDAGLTGRKIIIDTYGGWGAHGGGAFSGKVRRGWLLLGLPIPVAIPVAIPVSGLYAPYCFSSAAPACRYGIQPGTLPLPLLPQDPTKVDRSGAYIARQAAKSVVAAGLARRCLVQVRPLGCASAVLQGSGNGGRHCAQLTAGEPAAVAAMRQACS